MEKKVALSIIFILFVFTGCAPAKVWISSPVVQATGNQYYEVQLEPLTSGHKFFVSFRLSVTNRTGKNFEIDWNKTRYIHNGRRYGVFVFKGIKPEDIRNLTIPPDIIPAGDTFSKVISPYKLLARPPIRDPGVEATESSIYPGILPTGENGILLVVRQNGKEVVEQMSVSIVESKIQ